jgi:ABC-type glycerol-3-phosphate transport system permease component
MRQVFSYGILTLFAVIVAIPAVWFLITSIKRDTEYNAWPIRILPEVPQWSNYVDVFTTGGFQFHVYALRSALLAIISTVLVVTTSALAGYAFSRLRGVPGSKQLYGIVIALLILPGTIYLIPRFVWFWRLGIVPDTYWPWIVSALGANPFFIFMFRQFFISFPRELEDAAEVDGCGPGRAFWTIFLPNAKPVLATASIFSFQGIWGDYVRPAMYLSDQLTLLAVKLRVSYIDQAGLSRTTVTLAANVVFVLPLILLFFLGQKYILKGVVTSGLKG